jgi:predicted AAA+ superfamily ATPase
MQQRSCRVKGSKGLGLHSSDGLFGYEHAPSPPSRSHHPQPVVYLQGASQARKSTLVQALQDDAYNAKCFTLDDTVTLAAEQGDPDGFVTGLPERVILDEVQRVPGLFRSIKRLTGAQALACAKLCCICNKVSRRAI